MNAWQLVSAATNVATKATEAPLLGERDEAGVIWLDIGEVLMTVLTGLVVVFGTLIALTLIIWIFGKIMDAFANRKKNDQTPTGSDRSMGKASKPAEPVVEKGIHPSVVAVIAAAVASVFGKGRFTIRRISRSSSRNTWGSAGAAENVRPF